MTSTMLKNETFDLFQDFDIPLEHVSISTTWNPLTVHYQNFLGIKTKKVVENIELDLTCFMFNEDHTLVDSVFSTKHNSWLIRNNLPLGKNSSIDGAIQQHDVSSSDDLYKKVMTIDLAKINPEIDSIYFYLTFDLRKIKSPDFSTVKALEMTFFSDKNLQKKISDYKIDTENNSAKDEGIMVLGKLVRKNNQWKLKTIGKTIDEKNFILTKGI